MCHFERMFCWKREEWAEFLMCTATRLLVKGKLATPIFSGSVIDVKRVTVQVPVVGLAQLPQLLARDLAGSYS